MKRLCSCIIWPIIDLYMAIHDGVFLSTKFAEKLLILSRNKTTLSLGFSVNQYRRQQFPSWGTRSFLLEAQGEPLLHRWSDFQTCASRIRAMLLNSGLPSPLWPWPDIQCTSTMPSLSSVLPEQLNWEQKSRSQKAKEKEVSNAAPTRQQIGQAHTDSGCHWPVQLKERLSSRSSICRKLEAARYSEHGSDSPALGTMTQNTGQHSLWNQSYEWAVLLLWTQQSTKPTFLSQLFLLNVLQIA